METALRFESSTKRFGLVAKQRFPSEGNFNVTCTGFLNAKDGSAHGTFVLGKKYYLDGLTKVDVGARYHTELGEVLYTVGGKKKMNITDNGLLSLDVKGRVTYGSKTKEPDYKASVELSQKVFNVTEGQDLEILLGYEAVNRRPYARLRENNWTFNTDFHAWTVMYDL
ncbi:hypothetical protein CBR_g44541 [Chara braunii]|uniref:Uncharacterized protein n=1 Tax=Chara braunii TaxID=69332 RepID=A0A388LXN3_CHABU|nr:hypothetical protein CBR_g44541 [Chara braunii]|eukprot:GBG87084.1 hypothetical protein CBR_g44541 [Chara braunii]